MNSFCIKFMKTHLSTYLSSVICNFEFEHGIFDISLKPFIFSCFLSRICRRMKPVCGRNVHLNILPFDFINHTNTDALTSSLLLHIIAP